MVKKIQQSYRNLLSKTKELIILQNIQSLIQWDMETKMPPKGVEQRSQQLALLCRIEHKMSTSPQIGTLINKIKKSSEYQELDNFQKRNFYLIKKNYEEKTHLPEKLVTEKSRQQVITVNSWKKAKNKKDFNILKPELEKLVELNKKIAEILMKVKKTTTPYNALIDNFEPKINTKIIDDVFSRLQFGIKTLLKKIQKSKEYSLNQKKIPSINVEIQRKIGHMLTKTLGYDTINSSNSGGRIDETEHPFTTGYFDDVRITTHYYPQNYLSAIFSTLHESGHALYEQNINQKFKYQPIGSISSYGIHESQSRLYENIVGRSKGFWKFALPLLKKIANPRLDNLSLDEFLLIINQVKPSKIRIESDEVTYNMHIIIRYQIESDLFENKIEVIDLPDIWNEKYENLLGLIVENDSEGVMQDTHWASGYYGYFPSYALGNIYSGQIFQAIKANDKNYNKKIEAGDLEGLKHWLQKNVQSFGSLYDPDILIEKISGSKISSKPYLEYLNEKYREIYNF